jgi:GNAT superfamily N-acetyltransferase
MIPDRAAASFWAAFLRNRNVDAGTSDDGAIPVAGGYAIYVAGTHLDHALGAGTTRPLREDDLAVVEDFYAIRAHPARLELSEEALARDGELLRARGYADEDVVLAMLEGPVSRAGETPPGAVAVRTTTDRRAWAQLATRAFADAAGAGDAELLRRTIQVEAAAVHVLMIASVNGTDAGTGALVTDGDLAVLMGGAVLPQFRGHGVHAALLAGRLAVAHARGATRAAVKTVVGSPVERSAGRFGFARTGLRRRVRRDPV